MDQNFDKILRNLQRDLEFANDPTFKGHCQDCDSPIFGLDVFYHVVDEYKYSYHTACFKCVVCSKQLNQDEKFVKVAERTTCTDCYETTVVGKCAQCALPIKDAAVLKIDDQNFHQKVS